DASAGTRRAQAMTDLLRGLGDLVHARQHGRDFLCMQVCCLGEKADKGACMGLKGANRFCTLLGTWGIRKTMVTTRRSFLGLAAVNQCSGNSRGLAQPAVPGAQWANGAMGNAKWMGVRLKDVLDRAGVKPGALRVRFAGLDQPVVDGAPKFMKSLALDHARDGEVMIAYAMNGGQLPLLNGFPLRLVVPGWYSTYWVKMLDRIEVIATEDENFWTKNAYLIPDTPGA